MVRKKRGSGKNRSREKKPGFEKISCSRKIRFFRNRLFFSEPGFIIPGPILSEPDFFQGRLSSSMAPMRPCGAVHRFWITKSVYMTIIWRHPPSKCPINENYWRDPKNAITTSTLGFCLFLSRMFQATISNLIRVKDEVKTRFCGDLGSKHHDNVGVITQKIILPRWLGVRTPSFHCDKLTKSRLFIVIRSASKLILAQDL